MKKSTTSFFVISLLAVLFSQAVYAKKVEQPNEFNKFQITSDSHQENQPAIFKNNVVYADWGGGETGIDLRLYNIKTKEDIPLITKPGEQSSPDLYGRIVVWNAYNGNDYDIYGIDIITKKEFSISALTGSNQNSPAIFKNIVIWSDNRNGNYEIYGYNILTKKEFRITTGETNNYSPRIWGDKVVWYKSLGGGLYGIEGYNLKKKKIFNISSVDNEHQQTPDIYANQVVWIDNRDGMAKVYYKNIESGSEKVLTETGGKSWPRIFGKNVVWVDDEGNNAHNIYVYNLKKGNLIQVSDDGSQQLSPTIPDIWGRKIVWMSWHTGNGDIYGAKIK